MKSIEEIKIELTLKMLARGLLWEDFVYLPIDDELRTFVDTLGPECASWYSAYAENGTYSWAYGINVYELLGIWHRG